MGNKSGMIVGIIDSVEYCNKRSSAIASVVQSSILLLGEQRDCGVFGWCV